MFITLVMFLFVAVKLFSIFSAFYYEEKPPTRERKLQRSAKKAATTKCPANEINYFPVNHQKEADKEVRNQEEIQFKYGIVIQQAKTKLETLRFDGCEAFEEIIKENKEIELMIAEDIRSSKIQVLENGPNVFADLVQREKELKELDKFDDRNNSSRYWIFLYLMLILCAVIYFSITVFTKMDVILAAPRSNCTISIRQASSFESFTDEVYSVKVVEIVPYGAQVEGPFLERENYGAGGLSSFLTSTAYEENCSFSSSFLRNSGLGISAFCNVKGHEIQQIKFLNASHDPDIEATCQEEEDKSLVIVFIGIILVLVVYVARKRRTPVEMEIVETFVPDAVEMEDVSRPEPLGRCTTTNNGGTVYRSLRNVKKNVSYHNMCKR